MSVYVLQFTMAPPDPDIHLRLVGPFLTASTADIWAEINVEPIEEDDFIIVELGPENLTATAGLHARIPIHRPKEESP